jgi:hypothetical protein
MDRHKKDKQYQPNNKYHYIHNIHYRHDCMFYIRQHKFNKLFLLNSILKYNQYIRRYKLLCMFCKEMHIKYISYRNLRTYLYKYKKDHWIYFGHPIHKYNTKLEMNKWRMDKHIMGTLILMGNNRLYI